MFKSILAASLFATAALAVTVDPSLCYALSTGGVNYLDSTNSVLAVQVHDDPNQLNEGSDKGVRFRFPNGIGGDVVCQAHNDHFVGRSGDHWSDDVGSGSSDLAVIQSSGASTVTVGSNGVFIGSANAGTDAPVTSVAFNWDIREIPCLQVN